LKKAPSHRREIIDLKEQRRNSQVLPLEELLDYGPYDDNQLHALEEEDRKIALKLKDHLGKQTSHKEIEAD
jgi:hypothetical protein